MASCTKLFSMLIIGTVIVDTAAIKSVIAIISDIFTVSLYIFLGILFGLNSLRGAFF